MHLLAQQRLQEEGCVVDIMYPEVHTLADANLRLEQRGGTMLPKKPLGPL